MPVPIDIVASRAMDLYFANYRSPSDFFTEDDFVAHAAGVVGNLYTQEYKNKYAELRQERKEEVVSFDPAILNDQLLKVEKEGDDLFAKLDRPVMSFPFDEQGIGLQEVVAIRPLKGVKFERTTVSAQWQLDYVSSCGIVFYFILKDRIRFINKSVANLTEVKIWYVPSITDPNFLVPDGIFEFVVTTTAATIKEIVKGNVVKESVDGNSNKLIQTEINPLSLK